MSIYGIGTRVVAQPRGVSRHFYVFQIFSGAEFQQPQMIANGHEDERKQVLPANDANGRDKMRNRIFARIRVISGQYLSELVLIRVNLWFSG